MHSPPRTILVTPHPVYSIPPPEQWFAKAPIVSNFNAAYQLSLYEVVFISSYRLPPICTRSRYGIPPTALLSLSFPLPLVLPYTPNLVFSTECDRRGYGSPPTVPTRRTLGYLWCAWPTVSPGTPPPLPYPCIVTLDPLMYTRKLTVQINKPSSSRPITLPYRSTSPPFWLRYL